MARSLKENGWTDCSVLIAPVASLNLSWMGPVTEPSAGLVVQDSLRTNEEEGSKQYWNELTIASDYIRSVTANGISISEDFFNR